MLSEGGEIEINCIFTVVRKHKASSHGQLTFAKAICIVSSTARVGCNTEHNVTVAECHSYILVPKYFLKSSMFLAVA